MVILRENKNRRKRYLQVIETKLQPYRCDLTHLPILSQTMCPSPEKVKHVIVIYLVNASWYAHVLCLTPMSIANKNKNVR